MLALTLGCACAAADASAQIGYAAQLRGGPGFSAVGGWVELSGLDETKSLRVEIEGLYSQTFASPTSELSTGYVTGLAGGDQITIRQPATKADPDAVLTLADPAIDAAAGTVFGSVPDGASGEVFTDGACGRAPQSHAGVEGAFAFPYPDFDPGVFQTVVVTEASGDTTALTSAAAGETPCFQVNASSAPRSFAVAATHLTGGTLDTSRLVLLRDGEPLPLLNAFGDGTGVGGVPAAPARAGDELLLYTPADALDPTYTAALPQLSASFDTLTGLVSVTTPAASSLRADSTPGVNFRAQRDLSAGTTEFDFASPGDGFAPLDLGAAAGVAIDYANPGHALEYVVDAVRAPIGMTDPVGNTDEAPVQTLGAAPKLKVSLAGRFSVRALKRQLSRGLKLKFSSAARARYSLVLSLAATRGAKALKIATASGTARAGSGTATLKFTRSGIRALRGLKRTRSALLAVRASDDAGRVTRDTKKTRFRP